MHRPSNNRPKQVYQVKTRQSTTNDIHSSQDHAPSGLLPQERLETPPNQNGVIIPRTEQLRIWTDHQGVVPELPLELLSRCLLYCNFRDIFTFQMVCRRFQDLTSGEFWSLKGEYIPRAEWKSAFFDSITFNLIPLFEYLLPRKLWKSHSQMNEDNVPGYHCHRFRNVEGTACDRAFALRRKEIANRLLMDLNREITGIIELSEWECVERVYQLSRCLPVNGEVIATCDLLETSLLVVGSIEDQILVKYLAAVEKCYICCGECEWLTPKLIMERLCSKVDRTGIDIWLSRLRDNWRHLGYFVEEILKVLYQMDEYELYMKIVSEYKVIVRSNLFEYITLTDRPPFRYIKGLINVIDLDTRYLTDAEGRAHNFSK